MGPLCNKGGSRKKLLCLRRFQAHGMTLQEQEKRKGDRRKKGGV